MKEFVSDRRGLKVKYLVLYYLIATSAIPFFKVSINYIIIGTLFFGAYFFYYKKKLDPFYIKVFLLALVIESGQIVTNKYFAPLTTLGTFLRIFYVAISLTIIGPNFFKYYIKILYILVLISFIFYIPTIVFPGFSEFFIDNVCPYLKSPFIEAGESGDALHIIIHNFGAYDDYVFGNIGRNSGTFWEPGAYGGYLIIAIMINTLNTGKIWDRKSIVFILALITTFSTSAYIALMVFVLLYYYLYKRKIHLFILVPLFTVLFYYSFVELPFLQSKIQTQLEISDYEDSQYTGQRTRFVSAKLDFEKFLENPIFGKGRNRFMKYGEFVEGIEQHRNNGLTILLSTYGIIVFSLYFFYFFRSVKYYAFINGYNRKYAFLFIIIIFIIGFSEPYFIRPFFFALPLSFLLFRKEYASLMLKTKSKD